MIRFPGNSWTSTISQKDHLSGAAIKMPLTGLKIPEGLQPGSGQQVETAMATQVTASHRALESLATQGRST